MAKPRVFISSTFYDLKYVREELCHFVLSLGYDPVANEFGHIPFGSQEHLEEYCYKEIDQCDILISIIGGRYGSGAHDEEYSISQKELKKAIEQNKQVYIFIDQAVRNEYATYLKNKGKDIEYAAVDNEKIYSFVEEVSSLSKNNTTFGFVRAQDITSILREQWAGLFQRFLQEAERGEEVKIINDINTTSNTLKELVTYLANERDSKDETIKSILLINHPAFKRLKEVVMTKARWIFESYEELNVGLEWYGYKYKNTVDAPKTGIPSLHWGRASEKWQYDIYINKEIFDEDGTLKIFAPKEWKDSWITKFNIEIKQEKKELIDSDEIPF